MSTEEIYERTMDMIDDHKYPPRFRKRWINSQTHFLRRREKRGRNRWNQRWGVKNCPLDVFKQGGWIDKGRGKLIWAIRRGWPLYDRYLADTEAGSDEYVPDPPMSDSMCEYCQGPLALASTKIIVLHAIPSPKTSHLISYT